MGSAAGQSGPERFIPLNAFGDEIPNAGLGQDDLRGVGPLLDLLAQLADHHRTDRG